MAGIEAKAFSGTDVKYAQMLEEQEAKALQDAAQGAGTKDGPSEPVKCKDKCTPLDLPLKRSIKGGGPPSTSPHVNSAFTESIVCESFAHLNFFYWLIMFCFLRRRPITSNPTAFAFTPPRGPRTTQRRREHTLPPCPLSLNTKPDVWNSIDVHLAIPGYSSSSPIFSLLFCVLYLSLSYDMICTFIRGSERDQ